MAARRKGEPPPGNPYPRAQRAFGGMAGYEAWEARMRGRDWQRVSRAVLSLIMAT